MRGLKAALTRKPFSPDLGDERLGLMAALHAYTAGGAWAAHFDDVTGRLAPGLAADLVIIDGDIEATAPEALDRLEISLTVIGGRISWCAPGFR